MSKIKETWNSKEKHEVKIVLELQRGKLVGNLEKSKITINFEFNMDIH